MGYRQLTQGCWIARTGEEPAQSRTKPGKSIAQSAAMSTLRLATIHSGSSRLAGGTPGFSRDASIRTVLRQGTRSPMAVRGASGETVPRGRGLVCMSSRAVFRRLRRLVVVTATSTVVLASGAGMSAAYAAADHSTGTAGTSGTSTSPQPLSTADQNTGGANGQCPGGPYCSTRDGSPSGNGNGGGNATGKPCAGCVGKADNKNPPGQFKDGSDHNAGYECDRNHGIGRSNPAHTGCKPPVTTCPAGQHMVDGHCVTDSSGCPVGQHMVDGHCVTDSSGCPVGQHMVNGQCVTDSSGCPVGQHMVNGQCVSDSTGCPTGQHMVDGQCVTDSTGCPQGQTMVSGTCQTPPPASCPEGQHAGADGTCVLGEKETRKPPTVQGEKVVKPPSSLPMTGADVAAMLMTGMVGVGLGSALL